MARDVWSLEVFRRAYAVSLDIHRATLGFPKIEQYGGVAKQLRRSSKSVCALLTEGAGRQQAGNDTEFRRYVRMALGSAEESKLWCQYAEDLGYLAPAEASAWRETYGEIGRMLNGLLKRLTHSDE